MVFLHLEETAGLEVPEISHDPGYGHSSQKGTLGSESVEQTQVIAQDIPSSPYSLQGFRPCTLFQSLLRVKKSFQRSSLALFAIWLTFHH
jgi:hypothetical protein